MSAELEFTIVSRAWGTAGDFDIDGWSVTENVKIATNFPISDPMVIKYAPGMPVEGLSYWSDAFPISCKAIRPTQVENAPRLWNVEIEWSTRTEDAGAQESGGAGGEWIAPTARTPRVWWEKETRMEPLEVDLPDNPEEEGDPVVNSAGVPFGDPPVMVRRSYHILNIQRYESTLTPAMIDAWDNKVNALAFLGAQAGNVLCEVNAGEFEKINGVWYLSATWRFLFGKKSWQPRPANAGYLELVGGELKIITDVDGNPVSEPWPLDATGQALDPGYDPSEVTYKTFRGYNSANFNSLGFNLSTYIGTAFFPS